MHLGMRPGMVYEYPLWGVGLLLVGLAAVGAVFLDLTARQFLSLEFRRRHNDVAAAIFSVIGVTFAVLLAFVAMLAWEHFNKAKAASYVETALVLDVYNVSVGFADPEMSAMRRVVLPRRAPAGNQVEALGELGEQPRESAGSFWPSPSIGMMTSPVLCPIAAIRAAVWP